MSGAEGVTQFVDVGQPDVGKRRSQVRVGRRSVLQEKGNVGKVFGVGTPHHFRENEKIG